MQVVVTSPKIAYLVVSYLTCETPQRAEIRTVAKSLPLLLKNSANRLFINRLSQTEYNLKY